MLAQADEIQTRETREVGLLFLAWTFLRIGATAFGGFMALVSVVQTIVVDRKKWLRTEEMLDGVSLATILPGPVAINVVAYVGYKLRGGLGALVCATAVVLPSFLLLVAFTMAYLEWGEIPVVDKALMGFIPAVAAIILNAAWGMRTKALGGWLEIVLAILACLLMILVGGFYLTLGIVVGAGGVGLLAFRRAKPLAQAGDSDQAPPRDAPAPSGSLLSWLVPSAFLALFLGLFVIRPPGIEASPPAELFVTFSGMSLMLFGGGFVFIPLIQEIVVDGLHWVSRAEFASAIALGQITPGPILISATFIGYKVYGLLGAFLATFGIFFPPALLMVTASRALDRINHSQPIQNGLRGIRAAVVGLIVAAAIVVGQSAALNWATLVIFLATLAGLIRFKIDVAWLIPTAGLLGVLLH